MHTRYIPFIICMLLITACSTVTPVLPSATPVPPAPTMTPVPTWTPAPTPTHTPVPPMQLTLNWPKRVSPVDPPQVDVLIQPPPGVDPPVLAYAEILDPDANTVASYELRREKDFHYRAPEPLSLGLEPTPGQWWLIVRIRSSQDVAGMRVMAFEIEPVPYADLQEQIPEGLTHKIPLAFTQVDTGGTLVAGWRAWHTPDGTGALSLYWAPGPAEALDITHAVAMLEATYDDADVAIEDAEEIDWNGHHAVQFMERWGDKQVLAWVLQGPDAMLYVIRAAPLTGSVPSPLLEDVARGFDFAD